MKLLTLNGIGFSLLAIISLLACDQSKKAVPASSNHQGHTDQGSPTQHDHPSSQNPVNPLEFSGKWWGWVYTLSAEDRLLMAIEKISLSSAKVALPAGKSADDTELWSIKINFSQDARALSGSCTIQLTNSKNQQLAIEGTVTGKIDPAKKAVILTTDDNMDDPFGGRSITLHWQDATINKLSGSFDDDEKEEPPKPAEPAPSPGPAPHDH